MSGGKLKPSANLELPHDGKSDPLELSWAQVWKICSSGPVQVLELLIGREKHKAQE